MPHTPFLRVGHLPFINTIATSPRSAPTQETQLDKGRRLTLASKNLPRLNNSNLCEAGGQGPTVASPALDLLKRFVGAKL
jgi:hypothetical protein